MNDTVTKLMARVHAIENLASLAADPMNSESEQTEYVNDLVTARQALQDELTRLFTPLTDEHVYKIVRSKQPHLSDTSAAWSQECAECTYWLSAARGITGESK